MSEKRRAEDEGKNPKARDESDEEESDEEESDEEESKGAGRDSGEVAVGTAAAMTGLTQKSRSALRAQRGPVATWFRNVWTISKRELASYFNSPLAYIVVSVSLVGLGLICFFYQDFFQVNRASYAQFFGTEGPITVPILLSVIAAPLFTMRSLSEERRLGTIELLITLPVRDSEVILGKFVGAFTMLLVQILLLAAYPVVMFLWPWHIGAFDWGPFWASLLGLTVLSAASVGVGMMFSSFTESQILSFFMSLMTLAMVFYIGNLVRFMPGTAGDIIAFFSFQTRYEPFSRGVIDSKALVYFLSIAVITLLVAFRQLESRKWK